MVNTAINRENVVFNREAVDRVLFKAVQRRKIIILGANWKSVIFRGRYNINVEYYTVENYTEKLYGKSYDGVELRSIYDIAYETPGSFYIACMDIETTSPITCKLLMGLGLSVLEDFCILDCFDEHKEYAIDDVHLHVTSMYELLGVKIYGDEKDNSALRIITLGGSTTDALSFFKNCASWPQHLSDMLQRSNIKAVVFNCGKGSYASAREFIKFCRDGLTLDPDLVVSYSGVNELSANDEFFSNRYKRPWIDNWTEIQARTAKNHLGGNMSYGLQSENKPAETWVMHMKMMRGVCDELGIKFAAFFQPFMGTGESISEFEEALFSANEYLRFGANSFVRAQYNAYQYGRIAEYADSITELINNISYIFNERNLYKDNTELLTDWCHTTDAGNHLIAQSIFKILLKHNYFIMVNNGRNND